MHYSKPATTIQTQIALLRDRNMLWGDEQLVVRWLETVGYYRLSAYWLPYMRKYGGDLTAITTGEADNSIYNALVMLINLIRHQAPQSTFPQRMHNLIKTRSTAQQTAMGFPADWHSRPAWCVPPS